MGVSDEDVQTHSSVLLPDENFSVRNKVEDIVKDIVGDDHGQVTENRRGTIAVPWPTRSKIPLSEFTTNNFLLWPFQHCCRMVHVTSIQIGHVRAIL